MPVVVALSALAVSATAQPMTGVVLDPEQRPIAAARVRLSVVNAGSKPISGDAMVLTDADGRFELESPANQLQGLYIGVGKIGYLTVAGTLQAGVGPDLGAITLEAMHPIDNVEYAWWKPFWPPEDQSDVGCNGCHGEQARDWMESEMAQSAVNPRVLSLYEGTDLEGNPAGEGYRVDHPDQAGPCANCHAPAAAIDAPGETVLSEVEGIAREGVFCDVCHKIRDVIPDGGPGVGGSLQYQRPSAWQGLFAFGPYDDVAGSPMGSSFSELISTSRFCAGCHEWTNDAGVPVMSTFSEWSEVSGADPDALQCQDCHMKKKFGADYRGESNELGFIVDNPHVQQNHGILRRKSTIHPHTFHGAAEYVTEAAALGLGLADAGGALEVTVGIDNVNAGHGLPTGMPFRHAILVVEAQFDGASAALLSGPTVPDYGGVGDAPEDLAGRPGKGYAKVLGDGTGARNVPFWRATEVIEDTRIRGAESDEITFRFAAPPEGGEASVTARLVYRRAFREMVLTKGWDVEDIEMASDQATLELAAAPEPGADAGAPDGGAAADSEEGRQDGCGCEAGAGDSAPGMALLLVALGLGRRRRRG